MGQASNSHRNASLDSKKLRAAGRMRQNDPATNEIKEGLDPHARGKTGGAFGQEAAPDDNPSQPTGDAGKPAPPKRATSNPHQNRQNQ